jgi:hypothetical protein
MHTIKKLFDRSYSIKILFFKTFILPCFDYCTSLYVYYHQIAIHKLCKSYTIFVYLNYLNLIFLTWTVLLSIIC